MQTTESILINGKWRGSSQYQDIINPATGKVAFRHAIASREDVQEAVDVAASAFESWRKTSTFERAAILSKTATLITERADEIGKTLAIESGKLIAEAVGEVNFTAQYFSWFAEEIRRFEQITVTQGRPSGPQMVLRKPIGVVASLTPWNFPVSIQARKIAPAIAAGCTVVARPSEQAPESVVQLFQCCQDAGLPDGVLNLLTGPAKGVVEPLLEDSRVRVISFTGSTPVGRWLYERSAGDIKKLTLELGGCAPFIVCDDADPEAALEQAMLAKFRNCGQSCIAANCFYVHESLYEQFVSGLADRIAALRPGDPLEPKTTIGPLINSKRRAELEKFTEQALEQGFESRASAPKLEATDELNRLSPDCYFSPVLLTTSSPEMVSHITATEVFGPVAMVVSFSDLDRLVRQLNENPVGLAGYVFTRDRSRAIDLASALETGIVGVNEGLPSAANVPMGGVKQSGLGREGGHVGLEEFVELQYLAWKATR